MKGYNVAMVVSLEELQEWQSGKAWAVKPVTLRMRMRWRWRFFLATTGRRSRRLFGLGSSHFGAPRACKECVRAGAKATDIVATLCHPQPQCQVLTITKDAGFLATSEPSVKARVKRSCNSVGRCASQGHRRQGCRDPATERLNLTHRFYRML